MTEQKLLIGKCMWWGRGHIDSVSYSIVKFTTEHLYVVSRCFATLRQLRHLRHHITNDCLRSLVVLLVHSRLDYGNFVFVGLPAYLQRRL